MHVPLQLVPFLLTKYFNFSLQAHMPMATISDCKGNMRAILKFCQWKQKGDTGADLLIIPEPRATFVFYSLMAK